jgi:hypothetical protein
MSTNVIISGLESRRSVYTGKINDTQRQLAQCERSYETLRVFKENVLKSRDEFYMIKSKKVNALSVVTGIENSIIAKGYSNTIQPFLSGTHSRRVERVYTELLTSISSKLQSYLKTIDQCEDAIARYNRIIVDINCEIREEIKAQNVRLMAKGGQ